MNLQHVSFADFCVMRGALTKQVAFKFSADGNTVTLKRFKSVAACDSFVRKQAERAVYPFKGLWNVVEA